MLRTLGIMAAITTVPSVEPSRHFHHEVQPSSIQPTFQAQDSFNSRQHSHRAKQERSQLDGVLEQKALPAIAAADASSTLRCREQTDPTTFEAALGGALIQHQHDEIKNLNPRKHLISSLGDTRKPIVIGYTANQRKQTRFFDKFAKVVADTSDIRLVQLSIQLNSDMPAKKTAVDRRSGPCETETRPLLHANADHVIGSQASARGCCSHITNINGVDAILHKCTDEMAAAATAGDAIASERLLEFENILNENPHIVVVDDISGVWKLIDRVTISKAVRTALSSCKVRHLGWALIQAAASRGQIEQSLAGMEFPIILKRRLACGTRASHEMVVVQDMDGLFAALTDVFFVPSPPADCVGSKSSKRTFNEQYRQRCVCPRTCRCFSAEDVVAQEFIGDNGGVVYKVYAVGDRIEVNPRSSISCRPEILNTSDEFDAKCGENVTVVRDNNHYHKFDSQQSINGKNATSSLYSSRPPTELTRSIVSALSSFLGLSLLGVDLVFDIRRNQYAVVDVNYFPGYKGIEEAYVALLRHIEKLILRKRMYGQDR